MYRCLQVGQSQPVFNGCSARLMCHPHNLLKRMAGTTGLEPATSAVTGQRSNQLNYVPAGVRNANATLLPRRFSRERFLGCVSGLAARRFAKQPTFPNLTAPRLSLQQPEQVMQPFRFCQTPSIVENQGRRMADGSFFGKPVYTVLPELNQPVD